MLKSLAPIFVAVGGLHLVLGLDAEVLLGADLSAESRQDAVLDSQNRFYGVAFSLYGVLLYLCGTDVLKYVTVLRCVLWTFFAAGLARLVSVSLFGFPSTLVGVLLITELTIPPLLAFWLSRLESKKA